VRVLWTRRFIRLYPIFVESFLSVVWAWIFVSLTAFWMLCFAVGHNPLGGSLIPNYWGLLLFLCCLLQLSCGVWVDSKYDPELPPELYVSVFYPSFYWMLMATSSCLYTTKGMVRRLNLKSPTRWRIQRAQDATA
jgi:biofilm PGA synthesis N-glycosyltransferase PgaC